MKKIKLWRKKPTKKELMEKYRNDYMLLDRLRSDCAYFLGYGNRYEGSLWACNVKDQINYMKYLYRLVPIKPEWISKKDIRVYRQKMANRKCKLGTKEEFKKIISKKRREK